MHSIVAEVSEKTAPIANRIGLRSKRRRKAARVAPPGRRTGIVSGCWGWGGPRASTRAAGILPTN